MWSPRGNCKQYFTQNYTEKNVLTRQITNVKLIDIQLLNYHLYINKHHFFSSFIIIAISCLFTEIQIILGFFIFRFFTTFLQEFMFLSIQAKRKSKWQTCSHTYFNTLQPNWSSKQPWENKRYPYLSSDIFCHGIIKLCSFLGGYIIVLNFFL